MFEVEIKAQCSNVDDMKKIIADLGGTYVSTEVEEDSYFSHPARDFALTDEALRIRKVNNLLYVTYKGPRLGGKTKTRYEREVEVFDYEGIQEIFSRLGFQLFGTVQKTREMYLLGDVTVCCDDVKDLGTFVELEIISSNREEAEKKLFALAGQLGLSQFITSSYLAMLKES